LTPPALFDDPEADEAIVQDVLLAIKAGMQGVVLSNHGGRQLVGRVQSLSPCLAD
jgi:hypothetical protein